MPHHPLSWIDDELASLDEQHLRRRLATREGPQSARMSIDGRELVNFGSNDYLALAADPRLAQAVIESAADEGWGSGASPLVTGRSARIANSKNDWPRSREPKPPCCSPPASPPTWALSPPWSGPATWSTATGRITPACSTAAAFPAPMCGSIRIAIASDWRRCWPNRRPKDTAGV